MIFFSILFHPSENAIRNIKLAKSNGFNIVVYINAVSHSFIDELKTFKPVILGSNVNVGLGRAFSELETYLLNTNESTFVYFDQDTITNETTWLSILNSHNEIFSKQDAGAIFYGPSKSIHPKLVVSSGCAFSLPVIKNIGKHSIDYFVEGVDYEFCLRLKKFGYKIYKHNCTGVDHCSLQDGTKISLFGSNFKVRVYGNSRLSDFNKSHYRLLFDALNSGQYELFFLFLKSFFLFNLKEYFSRFMVLLK